LYSGSNPDHRIHVKGCSQAPLYENVLESGGTDPCILNLGIGWRYGQIYTPAALPPEERAPDMHLTEGWMEEPRSGLDIVEKRKICPYWESNQDFLAELSLNSMA
jgi:hypothetical protein